MKESIVYLDPIPHVYVHRETGEKYTSVTTVISTIEEDFDVEGVADKIAKMGNRHHNEIYHGMSKEQIIEYWTSINVEATDKGTEIHEILEEYLLRDKWFFPKNDLEKAAIEGYDSLNVDEGIKMHPEKVLFAEEFKIAGTADLVIDINDVFFDVGDWKSNKVLRYYNEFGNKTLLPPFDHLQDCEHNIYSLQLSVYALMYEMETGRKCRHIWIGHFDKTTHKMTKIAITYLKHEAKQLLKYYKYQNQLKF